MLHSGIYAWLQRLMMGLLLVAWALPAMGQQQPPIQPAPVQGPPPEGVNRIIIDSTDVFHFSSFGPDSIRIRKLIGHVQLSQDTTKLYCDSAYQFIDSNYVEAFSHVRIVMNWHLPDSMRRVITSDRLTFDGETKIINFWGNVVLRDKQVTLKTPRLTYYRIEDYAEYLEGGVIYNKENVLTSKKGYYYPKPEMAYFKDDVVLDNPDYQLKTDTLGYNTGTKVAFFLAPTYVFDSVNSMYTEDGYYDTEHDYAFLHKNASIGDTTYTLYADTIQYDQANDLGKALGHLRLVQRDSSLTVFGKYGEFRSKTEATFVTDSAFAMQRMDNDTLFMFADTLSSYKDTVTDKRYFHAYHNSKFVLREMQGACDSLAYWYDDSLMFFYQRPVMWSDSSQITGDTIIIQMRDGTIDSMSIPSAPFITTKEDTVGFDQIKGKRLHAKFRDKDLDIMWIFGNSESVYYTKDDKEEYLGMNRARCSDMLINFKENKPSRILFKDKPEGEFSPIHVALTTENRLEGFSWRANERPMRPEWVDSIIFQEAMRNDPLKKRLDSLMLDLEVVEFDIWNLINDSIYLPEEEALEIPEGGGIPKDSMAVDSLTADSAGVDTAGKPPLVKGGKGPALGKDGRAKAQPVPVLVKPDRASARLTQEQRRSLNSKQRQVARRRLREPYRKEMAEYKAKKKAMEDAEKAKAGKKPMTFKERWRKFRKDLKEPPTKDEIAKRQQAKRDRAAARIKRKADRMQLKQLRTKHKADVPDDDRVQPKESEFNPPKPR